MPMVSCGSTRRARPLPPMRPCGRQNHGWRAGGQRLGLDGLATWEILGPHVLTLTSSRLGLAWVGTLHRRGGDVLLGVVAAPAFGAAVVFDCRLCRCLGFLGRVQGGLILLPVALLVLAPRAAGARIVTLGGLQPGNAFVAHRVRVRQLWPRANGRFFPGEGDSTEGLGGSTGGMGNSTDARDKPPEALGTRNSVQGARFRGPAPRSSMPGHDRPQHQIGNPSDSAECPWSHFTCPWCPMACRRGGAGMPMPPFQLPMLSGDLSRGCRRARSRKLPSGLACDSTARSAVRAARVRTHPRSQRPCRSADVAAQPIAR